MKETVISSALEKLQAGQLFEGAVSGDGRPAHHQQESHHCINPLHEHYLTIDRFEISLNRCMEIKP
ncbi:MAG: hypothetical protein JWM16_5338 [Verrucomicrobiales bacterium]|nr:hypothetical protein [Verrucomicrobiales bacterium]